MEFSAVITSEGFQTFSGALQVLAALGEVVTLEVHNGQFVMSTLNSSRTGQGVVHLSRSFFKDFALFRRGTPSQILQCNVSNKNFYSIIKKNMGGYKSIKECQITITEANINAEQPTESRVHMKIIHANGVTKKNTLCYSSGDPIAMFFKTSYESRLICHPQLLKDFLVRFDHKTQNIEFTCTEQGLVLKTHPDNKTVSTGDTPVKSTFSIYKADFDTFDIKRNAVLVINLKEFIAIVEYVEYLTVPLELQFEAAGMPLLNTFKLENKVVSYMALQTVPSHVYDPQNEAEEVSFVDTNDLDYSPASSTARRQTSAPAPTARSTSRHSTTSQHRQQQQQQQQQPQQQQQQYNASSASSNSLPSTIFIASEPENNHTQYDDEEPLFTGARRRRLTQNHQ